MKIYVVEGEKVSLLGKEDAIALDIVKLEPQGEPKCHTDKRIRCLTQQELKPKIVDGIVSGEKPRNRLTPT